MAAIGPGCGDLRAPGLPATGRAGPVQDRSGRPPTPRARSPRQSPPPPGQARTLTAALPYGRRRASRVRRANPFRGGAVGQRDAGDGNIRLRGRARQLGADFPYYIPYKNEAFGRPSKTYLRLADSHVDWGRIWVGWQPSSTSSISTNPMWPTRSTRGPARVLSLPSELAAPDRIARPPHCAPSARPAHRPWLRHTERVGQPRAARHRRAAQTNLYLSHAR